MELINSSMISKWIVEERKKQGLKQCQLADMIGMCPQCLWKIEKGENNPSLDTFLIIVTELGYRVELVKENE